MKQVKVIIDEDGRATIETSGFKGSQCISDTEKLLQDLWVIGVKSETKDIKYKDEYKVQQRQTQVQR
jgi:hypothetical protein